MRLAAAVLLAAAAAVPLHACDLEHSMRRAGLVDVAGMDSTLRVEICNAAARNMLGENTYGCLTRGNTLLEPEGRAQVQPTT